MPFFGELRRRNVVKVAVAYAIVGWLLIEVSTTVLPLFEAPDWIAQVFAFFIILGFAVALILSWAYELTPEGIKLERNVAAGESITHVTGRKIDFAIIGVLAVAVAFFALDRFVFVDEGAVSESSVDRRSVAALPFSNDSAAAENAEFFANGIHDELLTRLANISSLKVISRTSVMEYRDRTQNMREIGRELGVATVLEGRVQRVGDMVRINVQLIDAETDEHLWAEIYNREITAANIFAIQSEMATSIAEALQATLLPQEVARLNEVPTESTRAYDFYLSGNDYYHRPDDVTFMPLAVQQYERAVEEDPDFALAWAALSRAHSNMHWYALDPTESRLEQARNAVDRAFDLDPELPEAHLALGHHYYQGFRDYNAALAEFDVAEQGMPGAAVIFELRAYVYRRMNEKERSVASMDRAIALDPRNVDLLSQQANTHMGMLNYTPSERFLQRALDVAPDDGLARMWMSQIPLYRDGDSGPAKVAADNPLPIAARFRLGWLASIYERDYSAALGYLDNWNTDVDVGNTHYVPKASYYGITHELAGRADLAESYFQTARVNLEEALESSPDDARIVVSMAEAVGALGDPEAAVRLARRAMELMPTSLDAATGPWIHLQAIFGVFVSHTDPDAVIDELAAYLDAPYFWSLEGLLPDPRLDPIRDNPKLDALVEKYGRP